MAAILDGLGIAGLERQRAVVGRERASYLPSLRLV
jgi:hypothetical protein